MLLYVQNLISGNEFPLLKVLFSGPVIILVCDLGCFFLSVLGKRLGKSMGAVAKEVKAMSTEDILAFEKAGEITIATFSLKLSDIKVAVLSNLI